MQNELYVLATEYGHRQGFALRNFFMHCVRIGDSASIESQMSNPQIRNGMIEAQGGDLDFAKLSIVFTWPQMCQVAALSGLAHEETGAIYMVYAHSARDASSIEELMDLNTGLMVDLAELVKAKQAEYGKYGSVRLAMQVIENRIFEDISAESIAAELHFNTDYLSRLFKEHTGSTLSTYIRTRKIEEAEGLLEQSILPISEIAARLGYCSQSHFSSVFKKEVGMTPRQYREKGEAAVGITP